MPAEPQNTTSCARSRACGVSITLRTPATSPAWTGVEFEDASARRLDRRRQPEREIERMNLERLGQMHRGVVALAAQHLAHLRPRPRLGVGAPARHPFGDARGHALACRPEGDQPAGRRLDPRHAGLGDQAAHGLRPPAESCHTARAWSSPTRDRIQLGISA